MPGSNLKNVDELVKSCFAKTDTNFQIDLSQDKQMTLFHSGEKVFEFSVATIENVALAHREMFDSAVQSIDKKEEKMTELNVRQNNLKESLTENYNSIRSLIDEKSKLENEMFGQFLPILKTKDEKISQLLQQVRKEDSENQLSSEDELISSPENRLISSSPPKCHSISSSDSGNNIFTKHFKCS